MSHVCFFDLIPVELLHTLFTYFSAHEILHTFCDVSDRMNDFLLIYSAYRLNLQSIQISDYNSICRRIQPEQVIYLRLSDDSNTPGLSEQFFSQFHIEQFTQLRSLILSEIEVASLESIFSNLHKLVQLRSLSFNDNTTRYTIRGQKTDSVNEINRIFSQIRNRYPLIVPQLNRLHLSNGVFSETIKFPYLLQLKLEKCSMNELKTIFLHAPLLKSLDICVKNEELTFDFILTSRQFTRLHLTIDNTLISMNIMEKFLSKLTCLKHFVFETHGQSDILNAQRWKNLTSNLITFNFKFYTINYSNQNLDEFRTSFWLEEKHWFVASDSNSIFSIPHFCPSEMTFSSRLFIDSTAPNDQVFYDQITKLTIVNVPNENNSYRFTHVKILNLKRSISFGGLLPIIHLNEVEQLSISSIDDILIFNPLVSTMPKLSHLSIAKPITEDQMKRMRGYQFKQIYNLTIGLDCINEDYIINALFYLFPRTKHLTCMTYIMFIDGIIHLISGFNDLSHASFYSYSSFSTTENTYCLNSKLCIPETRIFTSRIYCSLNNAVTSHINLWLKEQNSLSRIVRIVQGYLHQGHRYLKQYHRHLDNTLNTLTVGDPPVRRTGERRSLKN